MAHWNEIRDAYVVDLMRGISYLPQGLVDRYEDGCRLRARHRVMPDGSEGYGRTGLRLSPTGSGVLCP